MLPQSGKTVTGFMLRKALLSLPLNLVFQALVRNEFAINSPLAQRVTLQAIQL